MIIFNSRSTHKPLLSNYNKIFPVSGISNTETIYCNENGYYSFNSDGMASIILMKSGIKEIECLIVGILMQWERRK